MINHWYQSTPNASVVWISHEPTQIQRLLAIGTSHWTMADGQLSNHKLTVDRQSTRIRSTRQSAMMMLAITMPPISYLQVALASLALLLVMAISVWLKLGIVKSLLIASFRTVVQLSLIGLVLAWIFAREQWYEVLAILTFMSIVATIVAKIGLKNPIKVYFGIRHWRCLSVVGWWLYLCGWVLSDNAATWFRPQVMIPLLGLILGNSLTAVSSL